MIRVAARFCLAAACLLLASVPAIAATGGAEMQEVAVLRHAVARGEILSLGDFVDEERTAAQARGSIAAADAAGKEAGRNLMAGRTVRVSDVVAPRLVRRGQPAIIAIRSGGLVITATGRALGDGAAGDLVRVVSTATGRTLDGVVDEAGTVVVTAP